MDYRYSHRHLKHLIIVKSIKSICDYAFYECVKIQVIYSNNNIINFKNTTKVLVVDFQFSCHYDPFVFI